MMWKSELDLAEKRERERETEREMKRAVDKNARETANNPTLFAQESGKASFP
jgi:hypothetical protein